MMPVMWWWWRPFDGGGGGLLMPVLCPVRARVRLSYVATTMISACLDALDHVDNSKLDLADDQREGVRRRLVL